jgi:hypothetical protein
VWADGPASYLGIMAAEFPNMFMTYGPNTNLGHNSITVMIERQCEYIIQCLQGLKERGARAIMPTLSAQDAFNSEIQERLKRTSWADPNAESWYKNASGKITQNWSGSVEEYREAVAHVKWNDFDFVEPQPA